MNCAPSVFFGRFCACIGMLDEDGDVFEEGAVKYAFAVVGVLLAESACKDCASSSIIDWSERRRDRIQGERFFISKVSAGFPRREL